MKRIRFLVFPITMLSLILAYLPFPSGIFKVDVSRFIPSSLNSF